MVHSRTSGLVRFLSWLGGHERGTLLTMAGIAAGVWMFGWLADEVLEGGTWNLDHRLLLAMRNPGDLSLIGPRWVQYAARDITALGSAAVLGLLTAITAVYLALDGKRHMALFHVRLSRRRMDGERAAERSVSASTPRYCALRRRLRQQ